jgi:hypothetical protein
MSASKCPPPPSPGSLSCEPRPADDIGACLAAIAELAGEQDIPREERALRLGQYAACAAGADCPEVAFDPVAARLRAAGARLRRTPAGVMRLAQLRTEIESLLDRPVAALAGPAR